MRASRWSIEMDLRALGMSVDFVLLTISSIDCSVTCYCHRFAGAKARLDHGQNESRNQLGFGSDPPDRWPNKERVITETALCK